LFENSPNKEEVNEEAGIKGVSVHLKVGDEIVSISVARVEEDKFDVKFLVVKRASGKYQAYLKFDYDKGLTRIYPMDVRSLSDAEDDKAGLENAIRENRPSFSWYDIPKHRWKDYVNVTHHHKGSSLRRDQ
jgi:hypothetical protein